MSLGLSPIEPALARGQVCETREAFPFLQKVQEEVTEEGEEGAVGVVRGGAHRVVDNARVCTAKQRRLGETGSILGGLYDKLAEGICNLF